MTKAHKTLLSTVVVASGDASSITKLTRQAIRNQKDWDKVWAEHTATSVLTVVHRPPAVDFTKLMVIAIWHGTSTNGGPRVAIEEVEEKSNSILVTYRIDGKITFDKGDISFGATVYNHPYQIVTIKRSSKRVRFQEAE